MGFEHGCRSQERGATALSNNWDQDAGSTTFYGLGGWCSLISVYFIIALTIFASARMTWPEELYGGHFTTAVLHEPTAGFCLLPF